MARSGVVTTPPPMREVDWGGMVRRAWGDDWLRPEIAYRFSNGRTFNDSGPQGALYGTGT